MSHQHQNVQLYSDLDSDGDIETENIENSINGILTGDNITNVIDISINTFMLSPGPPINTVIENDHTCLCCMENSIQLSKRSYRSCKATPKHTICKECFKRSNKRECFFCFPYGESKNVRREQITTTERIYTIQELNRLENRGVIVINRRRRRTPSEEGSHALCMILCIFFAFWVVLILAATL